MKTKILQCVVIVFFTTSMALGQLSQYNFRQELPEINYTWQQIEISPQMFSAVLPSLKDIRIIGFTPGNDTVEAAYIIEKQKEIISSSDVPFKLINLVNDGSNYYSTFSTLKQEAINSIKLELSKQNYNMKVKLEGSNDQIKWYEILNDYRLVGIRNEFVSYNFSRLEFNNVQYKYFRVSWPYSHSIELNSASLKQISTTPGKMMAYKCSYKITEDESSKLTIVDLYLADKMPVSKIKLDIDADYDFYRPISFQKIIDSTKIKKTWQVYYSDIDRAVLSSLEKPEFSIPELITNRLRLLIYNYDNEPVKIQGVHLYGEQYQITARFIQDADYFIYFGNPNAERPNYDLKYFDEKIPDAIPLLVPGALEQLLDTSLKKSEKAPNKVWLWIVMGLIVVVLGGFTIQLIRKS